MADPLDQLTSVLGDRYAIERPLGSGGMATVYLAHDRRYDREVAIKVVRPDLAAALGTDRFLREIRITAQLNHPHILPLLDSGGDGDVLYYVMPYVTGGSLRHRLREAGLMPPDAVVPIVRQVAAALDHAHRHGIVHRDVKPENILFSEGLPVVADFGIARAVSAAGGEGLTRTGIPLGTPGYMSPEQASGRGKIDERTDVCGLACVAFEMLVGDTPAVWTTPDEVRLGRFSEILPAHRDRLDRLPGRIEPVLVRGLAIRPAERFESCARFADALTQAVQPSPRLGDRTMHDVLRRAGELDAERPTEGDKLSLGAVEQAGAAAGIPVDIVRAAARDLATPQVTGPALAKRPLGPPLSRLPPEEFDLSAKLLKVDRQVQGELAPGDVELLVTEIQSALGMQGHVSAFEHSLVWSPAAQGTGGRHLLVSLTSREGKTLVHVEERLQLTDFKNAIPGFAAAGGALVMLGFLSAFGASGPAIIIPMGAAAAGSAVLAVRGVIVTTARQRLPELRDLADRVAATIARRAPRRIEPEAAT